jgi:type IV pilus assembly protein PilQ
MKKGFFQITIMLILLFPSVMFSAELKAINFSQKGEISELEFILSSSEVEASKFQIKDDKQIIIDFSNTLANEKVMRAFDTSQFSGGVVFVKAYKKPKTEKDIRVAIQLRDNVRSVLVRKPNKIILQIENRYGVFTQKQADEGQAENENESSLHLNSKVSTLKPDVVEDVLENLIQSGKKKYIGKKITMNLKNSAPAEILRMIADSVGFNLVLSDDVKSAPPVSLNLIDTAWDQVLDTVLEMSKLVAKKNGVILIVYTMDAAIKEERINKEAMAIASEVQPMLNRIFPISFADINSLQNILSEYKSEKRGKINLDKRTNSLIVKDTAENIEKMKKMIELLDTQTPQILIEAKIVEVSEKYSKEIGLEKGLSFGYDPFSAALRGGAVNTGPGFSFSTATTAGTNAIGVTLGRLNKVVNLNFNLRLMESEAKAKIISSPKVITKNNITANIVQNETVHYADQTQQTTTVTTGTTAAQPPLVVWKAQESKMSLQVTPQVTNEGSINLKVDIKKGSLGAQGGASAPHDQTDTNVNTEVLVDNGSTIVIGGIYSYTTAESHSGIPFLKDIPVIGWLFRTYYNPTTDKKELIIFLSPRIINQEEAGLTDKG